MKKDKKWLKEELVQSYLKESVVYLDGKEFQKVRYFEISEKKLFNLINQLDDPEVLSQEWIDEHAVAVAYDGIPDQTEIVYVDELENLIVPKQEELESKIKVLIEAYKQEEDAYGALENGWIRGFIKDLKNLVEEEQRYYVMNNDNRMMLGRMMDGKTITEADPFKLEDMYEGEKKSHRLTEQEIKDYDPRYWAFRKPVEELEE